MAKATKLDCVNTMLSNIGQAPVTSLESGNPLVELAENILDEVDRTVQSEGWVFNTERNYPVAPDSEGHILIPENVLNMDLDAHGIAQVIQRQGKLYDKVAHTFVFQASVSADIVWLEAFDDLPEAFKYYITIRAANLFAGRSVGSQEAVRFGQTEELYARAAAIEYDTKQGDYNVFNDRLGGTTYRGFMPINAFRRF